MNERRTFHPIGALVCNKHGVARVIIDKENEYVRGTPALACMEENINWELSDGSIRLYKYVDGVSTPEEIYTLSENFIETYTEYLNEDPKLLKLGSVRIRKGENMDEEIGGILTEATKCSMIEERA